MSDRAGSGRTRWWIEVAAIAWLYWVYDAINNLSPLRRNEAIAHARSLISWERAWNLDVELSLNSWLAGHGTLSLALSDFYNVAHLVLTFLVLCWLWWWFPSAYPRLRNALVLTNVIGFAVYWLYPLAPPRMLPGFVDTITSSHALGSWHDGELGSHANEFAAMPSLHVAWALWCTVAICAVVERRSWRVLAVVHSLLTVVVVLATGNHYTLDVVAGGATAALAFAMAAVPVGRLVSRQQWRRSESMSAAR